MTVWDYSTDLEVVMVNYDWWNELDDDVRKAIQSVANASTDYQAKLLQKNTVELRNKIKEADMKIYYMKPEDILNFRNAVKPVWAKLFGPSFTESFLAELDKY